jgi:hypothetical protein
MSETEQSTGDSPVEKQPDETSGFHYESHIKIFDPESEEVFVSTRA